ncbi:hypothetical protein F543_6170 [Bibersteinia trehalosi USDA-ARS-USMARC-189]|uniref:Uncharacterized protein n=1 Tax=Bibersteinia trehalosi USDA-ARS-USMARC-189 TaxID=1263831 RepID=A0ABN4BXS2_BIBTR|nr:hypothetical protein WQG_17080 [Bibersteinia trehalosi USDA-ARS-USMARC-192]AHG83481.1 hypothetical protein F543_6170 [Bibersteinia trehalosi USDA-ARS-USMARC-189]
MPKFSQFIIFPFSDNKKGAMHRKAPVFNTSVPLIPEKFRQIPIILFSWFLWDLTIEMEERLGRTTISNKAFGGRF